MGGREERKEENPTVGEEENNKNFGYLFKGASSCQHTPFLSFFWPKPDNHYTTLYVCVCALREDTLCAQVALGINLGAHLVLLRCEIILYYYIRGFIRFFGLGRLHLPVCAA